MKKFVIAALMAPLTAFAQTYPSPTFSSITLQNPLTPANGGTGVANSGTITLGGNLTTSGGNPIVLNTTGSTNVTLPTSGTLLNGTTGATAGANSNITSLTGLTTPLAVSEGGTGVTSSTGSGSTVLSTSPVLVTPNLGTPSAITLTNGTGLPLSTGISGFGTGVAAALGTSVTGSGGLALATSPALSNPVVGTQSFGNSSALAASTGFVAAHETCKLITDFGGSGNGTTDNLAAYSSAYAASVAANSGRGCVRFGPGKFMFSGMVRIQLSGTNDAVSLLGAGPELTELTFSNTSAPGIQIEYSNKYNSAQISGMTISARAAGANYGVNLVMEATSPTTGQGQFPISTIERVNFRGSDGWGATNYWSADVHVAGVSNINFNDDVFFGDSGVDGIGIFLDYAPNSSSIIPVVYNLYGCSFLQHNVGLLYAGNAQGVSVVASNFTANHYGIQAPATGSAALDQLSVINSQFNNFNLSIDMSNWIQGVSITGSLFLVQNNAAAISIGVAAQYAIVGNQFGPGSASPTAMDGIRVGTYNQGAGIITGNLFDGINRGVWLMSGSQYANVQSNNYSPNVTTKVTNNGTNNTVGGGSL